jgi:hypothetical protein
MVQILIYITLKQLPQGNCAFHNQRKSICFLLPLTGTEPKINHRLKALFESHFRSMIFISDKPTAKKPSLINKPIFEPEFRQDIILILENFFPEAQRPLLR